MIDLPTWRRSTLVFCDPFERYRQIHQPWCVGSNQGHFGTESIVWSPSPDWPQTDRMVSVRNKHRSLSLGPPVPYPQVRWLDPGEAPAPSTFSCGCGPGALGFHWKSRSGISDSELWNPNMTRSRVQVSGFRGENGFMAPQDDEFRSETHTDQTWWIVPSTLNPLTYLDI